MFRYKFSDDPMLLINEAKKVADHLKGAGQGRANRIESVSSFLDSNKEQMLMFSQYVDPWLSDDDIHLVQVKEMTKCFIELGHDEINALLECGYGLMHSFVSEITTRDYFSSTSDWQNLEFSLVSVKGIMSSDKYYSSCVSVPLLRLALSERGAGVGKAIASFIDSLTDQQRDELFMTHEVRVFISDYYDQYQIVMVVKKGARSITNVATRLESLFH